MSREFKGHVDIILYLVSENKDVETTDTLKSSDALKKYAIGDENEICCCKPKSEAEE